MLVDALPGRAPSPLARSRSGLPALARDAAAVVRSVPLRVLAVLVAVDVTCLLVAVVKDPPGRWETTLDRGNLEIWGFLKLAGAIVILVRLAARTHERPIAAAAVALVIVLVDDAVGVHEVLGRAVVDVASIERAPFGLRPFDVGQLVVWCVLAVIVASVVTWGLRRGGARARAVLAVLATLLAVLGALAVGLDAVRAALSGGAERAAGYLEDGGEQLVISALAAVALAAPVTTPRLRGR
jgi:hypothetical protein